MAAALLSARLVLAIVLSIAAVAKLADREGFVGALRAFHVPTSLLRPLAFCVPAVELAVAIGLVPTALARPAALAALAILALFLGAIAVALRGGYSVECRCFGSLGDPHLGWRSLFRNLVLAALALFVVVSAPADAELPVLRNLTDEILLGGGLCVALAGATLLVRRQGRRPEIGERSPIRLFRTIDGEAIDPRTSDSSGTLLLFWDPSCAACEQMRPYLAEFVSDPAPERPRVLVVSTETAEAIRAALPPLPVARDESRTLADAFGIPGRPAAVLLDREGRVASDVILGTARIAAALRGARGAD